MSLWLLWIIWLQAQILPDKAQGPLCPTGDVHSVWVPAQVTGGHHFNVEQEPAYYLLLVLVLVWCHLQSWTLLEMKIMTSTIMSQQINALWIWSLHSASDQPHMTDVQQKQGTHQQQGKQNPGLVETEESWRSAVTVSRPPRVVGKHFRMWLFIV